MRSGQPLSPVPQRAEAPSIDLCGDEGRADAARSAEQCLAGAGKQLSDGCYRKACK